jgi:hypothetical protein
MHDRLFEAALGIISPWFVAGLRFAEANKILTIGIDFTPGSRFAGKLAGFTLLCEALVLMLARQMPFAAVARIVGISAHRVLAICKRYVGPALAQANFSNVRALAIDETSRTRRRRHNAGGRRRRAAGALCRGGRRHPGGCCHRQ